MKTRILLGIAIMLYSSTIFSANVPLEGVIVPLRGLETALVRLKELITRFSTEKQEVPPQEACKPPVCCLTKEMLGQFFCSIEKGKKYQRGTTNIHIVDTNIFDLPVEAIVNAANKTLTKTPGGVAGAVWKEAGSEKINKWIQDNFIGKKQGTDVFIETGNAIISPSFDIKNKGKKTINWIIHAVGPNCSLPAKEDI